MWSIEKPIASTCSEEEIVMEANVQTSRMYYSESLLRAWRKGDYSMLLNSDASDYIKNILTSKAKKSPLIPG